MNSTTTRAIEQRVRELLSILRLSASTKKEREIAREELSTLAALLK